MNEVSKERRRRHYQKPLIEAARVADVVRGSGATSYDKGTKTPYYPADAPPPPLGSQG